MNSNSVFPPNLVKSNSQIIARPRFSLTSDIISYRKCPRQYGYFAYDGFEPARSAQMYFGQIIHQVLDRCHGHYLGQYSEPKGSLPNESDVEKYFTEVNQALKMQGTHPISSSVSKHALKLLRVFNKIEGPALYPRVVDTECRLETENEDYILRGVVDVIASTNGEDGFEIWDYKGSKCPDRSSYELQMYKWQMSVYAELYKAKLGQYPRKAILYFLDELDTSESSYVDRPVSAIYEIDFLSTNELGEGELNLIQTGLSEFDKTAHEIIMARKEDDWQPSESPNLNPGEETCVACDLRWNCEAHPKEKFNTRLPIY